MEYSIVLTKAAFVHSKYLELYSGGMVEAMAKVRDYVDAHRNCEDIAMQMV
ncbi:unnamed protein product, partial [Laminaria digitata]